jgi:hypothetical protein
MEPLMDKMFWWDSDYGKEIGSMMIVFLTQLMVQEILRNPSINQRGVESSVYLELHLFPVFFW